MANHCIDCDFCGQDQRSVGSRCCPEYIAHVAGQQQKKETLDKQEDEILARHGLKTCYDRKVYAKDVVDFLLHLEGRVDHE